MPALLGLDYGLRRIGIAACSAATPIALAIGTHEEGRDGSIFSLLARLVREREVETIVVGLPLTAAGEEADLAARARAFGLKLGARLPVTVVMWDERYSSQEAERWLQAARRPVRGDRDALAAEIILQSYLDSLAASAGDPER